MANLIIMCMAGCVGILIGTVLVFIMMGKALRDAFFGINVKDKPIVINWIDGRNQDVNIMMRDLVIFSGKILTMNISRTFYGRNAVNIELIDKTEAMREFRS